MLIAQIVGIVGLFIIFAIFQFDNRRTILRLQLVSGLVWALHYILLGALTGAFMNGVAAGRNYFFEKYRDKSAVLWVSLTVFIIAGVISWKDWSSILPIIGMCFGTLAVWQRDPRRIRFLMLFVSPLWFTYNIIIGSYPGLVGDGITFISVLIGIYRFDIRRQPELATVPVITRTRPS